MSDIDRHETSARRPARRTGLALAGLVLAAALSSSCGPREIPTRPDDVVLLVHGGTIHSMDPRAPEPAVMAIDGRGFVRSLGGEDLLRRHPRARRLDLAGRTALPGFIDAHAHFLGLGRQLEVVDLRGCRSPDEMLERVTVAIGSKPEGEFVTGRGWNHELWPERELPTHHRLSALVPDHPVLLRRVDGHATLANARAMSLAGITAATVAPPGGEILRDAAGRPTGVFVDAAAALLPRPPAPSGPALRDRALAAQEACFAVGLTGVHDMGVSERELALYERLAATGELKIRLTGYLAADFDARDWPAPWLRDRLDAGPVHGAHDGRLSIVGVKLYADGALGSRGAALLAPYADRPETSGLLQVSEASLLRRVRACRAAGFQPAVHAIGDAANRMVLDVYEELLGDSATASDHRWRVEHVQVLGLPDLPRFAELGVVASTQPTHATSDMNMAEDRLGPHRIHGAYAWRKLLRSGARLALGSDFPVESERPTWGLFAAVARTDHDGRPVGGWYPHEALSRREALRGFTADAAWAGLTDSVGALSPGRRADFVEWDVDPLRCPPDELVTARPVSTWIGGVRVFPARAVGDPR